LGERDRVLRKRNKKGWKGQRRKCAVENKGFRTEPISRNAEGKRKRREREKDNKPKRALKIPLCGRGKDKRFMKHRFLPVSLFHRKPAIEHMKIREGKSG